jgi:hypothetical protein
MDTKERGGRTRGEEAEGYDPERSSDHEAFGGPDHYEAKEDLDNTKHEAPDARTTREETGVHAQPPAEFTGLKLGKHKEVAAGIPAVISSMRYALRETGLIRGARLLTTMNQKDGFDCTSCAWPDPDEHRSVAEFCENGAKAVLDEGTVKRVTSDFFKKHSVAELSERSDFWLNNQGRLTQPMFLRKGGTHYEPIGWETRSPSSARS